jgi:hypothetical protein
VLFLVHRFLSPWWRRRQVPPKRRFLREPHGVTTQKTPFFIVTAVKTSNLTLVQKLYKVEGWRMITSTQTLSPYSERKREQGTEYTTRNNNFGVTMWMNEPILTVPWNKWHQNRYRKESSIADLFSLNANGIGYIVLTQTYPRNRTWRTIGTFPVTYEHHLHI